MSLAVVNKGTSESFLEDGAHKLEVTPAGTPPRAPTLGCTLSRRSPSNKVTSKLPVTKRRTSACKKE